MRSLNILHISDSHIQKKDEKEIREIVQKMIIDINKVQNEKNINIDMICFTGDLIQRGDEALEHEGQWKLANDILVTPLLENLNLSEDRFIFVPGNHEVDKNEIVDALEFGLQVDSLDKIKGFMDRFNPIYKDRLKYFYDIVGKSGLNPTFGILGYSLQKEINGIEIGLACIDSAWRSSGKGTSERGHLYIGLKQIQELYANIKNASLKIGLLHHPVEWMEECERLEIERELSKFDIVLSGHIHETDLKQVIRRRTKTIYSTAGKLYPLDYAEGRAKDGYNGYSILNIRYDETKCNVFFRTYYAQNRNEFDVATIICEGGEECYEIGTRADMKQLQWGLIGGISEFFHKMSDKYNLINDVDTKSPKSLQQIFVSPVLAEKSEYIKENQDSKVDLQDIFDQDDNIFLIGKKESGKTTILQQIGLKYSAEYSIRGIIPVYIDLRYLPKGNDKLLNSTIQFIQKNIADNDSISRQKILELLTAGNLLMLLDNVEIDNSRHTSSIVEFTDKYSKNRFILAAQEDFFQSLDIKQIPQYGIDLKTIYIQYMGKAQIRELVTKWANFRKEDEIDINDVVNKIDSYCNQINFAKTPFNITIFLVLWDEDNNFIPINEGIVMENYIEVILEKLSEKESLRSEYGFKIKQDFLSYIAHEMYLRNRPYLLREEFNELVQQYHKRKGFRLDNSKFDVLFFEKNLLSKLDEYIVFSCTSFGQYFLAQYAYHNDDFLDEITRKGKRVYFKNEICFYSGLKQNCVELLENLSNDILDIVIEHIDLVDELNEMQIMTEFKIDKEELISGIKDNRLSQEELDEISDNSRITKEVNPMEIKEQEIKEDEAEDFLVLLQIYGSIIKNAELIDNTYKISHLEYYMYGMNMLYSITLKLSERIIEELSYDELKQKMKSDFKFESEEEFEKEKPKMYDYIKIFCPIAIQNIIIENVGTPKLEIAINSLMKSKSDKAFELFMLTFLKCDLKIANIKKILEDYIKREGSKDILKLALFKVTFYYESRFFGNNEIIDKDLLDLADQIRQKINPPQIHYIHKMKKKKKKSK